MSVLAGVVPREPGFHVGSHAGVVAARISIAPEDIDNCPVHSIEVRARNDPAGCFKPSVFFSNAGWDCAGTAIERVETGCRIRPPSRYALRRDSLRSPSAGVSAAIADRACPAEAAKGGEGWRRERDSNPRCGFPHSGFQDRLFQPLTHPSTKGNFELHPTARSRMRSVPMYGLSADGMTTDPSSCWQFSRIAISVRPTASPDPFSVCANCALPVPSGR